MYDIASVLCSTIGWVLTFHSYKRYWAGSTGDSIVCSSRVMYGWGLLLVRGFDAGGFENMGFLTVNVMFIVLYVCLFVFFSQTTCCSMIGKHL